MAAPVARLGLVTSLPAAAGSAASSVLPDPIADAPGQYRSVAGSSVSPVELSQDDVRRMTLRAQGFVGASARNGGVPGVLRRVGGGQLDTISVLGPSHELVAYARLGAVPREQIERAYWNRRRPDAFEYWSHAACVLPIEEWPYYAFRRRALAARGLRWHPASAKAGAEG